MISTEIAKNIYIVPSFVGNYPKIILGTSFSALMVSNILTQNALIRYDILSVKYLSNQFTN